MVTQPACSRPDIAAAPDPGINLVEEWSGLDSTVTDSFLLQKEKANPTRTLSFVTVSTHSELAFLVSQA